jgi:hypothetical protein
MTINRIDEEREWVVREAWALGSSAYTCDCDGTGVFVSRTIQSTTAEKITHPCPGCEGSRRWWDGEADRRSW